jgi:glycosyltransferase involved in cell wall biosynthesis
VHITIDARLYTSSGIGRYIRDIVHAIKAKGHILTLIKQYSKDDEYSKKDGINIILTKVRPYNPIEQILLSRIIPECDIYFSPHINATILPIRGKRRVVTIHDVFHLSNEKRYNAFERAYAKILYSCVINIADQIITVSHFTRDEIIRIFPNAANKITIIPNSVREGIFYPQKKRNLRNYPYIIFVGNMKPHKNLITAVDALNHVEDKAMRLIVVGKETGFRHGMESLVKSIKKEPRIELLGYLSDDVLRELYCGAECCIFPSLYEGFGYPIIESMACGVPVVCSDLPSLRETGGSAPLYCDPRQPAQFAKSIDLIRKNNELRKILVTEGFKRVDEFKFEKFAKKTLSVLENIRY